MKASQSPIAVPSVPAASIAPDKRDQYCDGEMSRGLAAFGDIRSKPFCVFDSVQSSPLIYGDHRYSSERAVHVGVAEGPASNTRHAS